MHCRNGACTSVPFRRKHVQVEMYGLLLFGNVNGDFQARDTEELKR